VKRKHPCNTPCSSCGSRIDLREPAACGICGRAGMCAACWGACCPGALGFLREHHRRETAPRRTCPECFFETGALDARESHTSDCSRKPGESLLSEALK
jgi:hypothetical protein